MTKFRQGMKFRHDNTVDTDIVIVSVDHEDLDCVTVTVMYVSQASGRPLFQKDGERLGKQQITIKNVDYDKWKHVVEEES